MATPFGPETQSLFRLLLDGRWHDYNDTLARLAAMMPPGKALRRYENRKEKRRDTLGSEKTLAEPTEDEKIAYGQRLMANGAFNSVRVRYLDVDHDAGGFGRRMIRIKPGVAIPGVTRSILPGAAESPPEDDTDQEDHVEPDEPYEAAEGAAEAVWPEDPVRVMDARQFRSMAGALDGETRDAISGLFQAVPTRQPVPPPTPIAPEPAHDPLAPYACQKCGLLVVQEELHQAVHAKLEAAAEAVAPREEMALFSETEVRELVAEEVGRALDGFQKGLQGWFTEQLAEIEHLQRQNQPGPPPCVFDGWSVQPRSEK